MQRVGGHGESDLLSRLVTLASHGAEYVPLVARLIHQVWYARCRAGNEETDLVARRTAHLMSEMLLSAGFAREALGVLNGNTETSAGINALFSMGRYPEALHACKECLNTIVYSAGKENPAYLSCLSTLAVCHSGLENHEEALRVYMECREGRSRILGEDHPDYISCLSNMANCYSKLHRHGEALKVCEECLKARYRVLGKDHPDSLACLSNLANCYGRLH